MLQEDGHEVFEAATGGEALLVLEREAIALVVLDIRLERESGLDLLQSIVNRTPDLPVILCSAFTSFQDNYTSWLADSYLVKSSDPEELRREVQRVLASRADTGGSRPRSE